MCEELDKFYVFLTPLQPVCGSLRTAILLLGAIMHDMPLQLCYVFGLTCSYKLTTVIIVVHAVAGIFTIGTESKALSLLSYL